MKPDTLTAALEQMKTNTKDFPPTLKAVMATDALAIAIHYCRATFYNLPATAWDDLSDERRDLCRVRARNLLEALGQHARSGSDLSRELFALGCALNHVSAQAVTQAVYPREVKK